MTFDERDEQEDKLQDFQVDSFLSILKDADGVEGMSVLYISQQLFDHAFVPEVYQGMFLAGGAFMFILIFITFHTRSLFISCLTVFSILCSFFGTNLIYNLVFDYDYFGVLQILAMFIILGIGADNVFVLVDSWRAAGFEGYTDLEERLTVCYKRAAKATFVTSLTTCVAFLSNAFSPILVSSSFGVFAGVLVMFNYVSVLLFLPNVLMMHHLRWADKTWPCCRCCKRQSDENKQGIVVRFFHGPLFKFITHKILRWIILLLCAGLLAAFIYSATRIESAIGRFQMFRDENNFQKISVALSTQFLPATNTEVDVYLVWGLQEQDYSNCNPRALKCDGKTTWDDSFDLDVTSAQTSLRDLCTTVENMNDDQAAKLRVKKDEATGKRKVTCFIHELADFMNTDAGLNLPFNQTNMLDFVRARPSLYNFSDFNAGFRRYFETALGYWLENKYSGVKSDDYRTFFRYVGEGRDDSDTHNILDPAYSDRFYGTRMRYAGISVKTTLTPQATGHEEGLGIIDAWENYMKELKKSLPESLQGGFQCTPSGEWTWYHIQDLNQQAAVQGIAIGLSMAFVILTLTTTNIVIGFLATLNIVCVTACVLGLIPFAGWKLGLVESLNLALVVGLAVDYVVHLAEAYHSAEEEDRVGKVRHMLTRVGVSILSGAATTLGSSIFMCFGTLQFFLAFGVFIITTITLSLFFSIFLFGTAMAIIGPTGSFGSIIPIWTWIKNKCFCCRKPCRKS